MGFRGPTWPRLGKVDRPFFACEDLQACAPPQKGENTFLLFLANFGHISQVCEVLWGAGEGFPAARNQLFEITGARADRFGWYDEHSRGYICHGNHLTPSIHVPSENCVLVRQQKYLVTRRPATGTNRTSRQWSLTAKPQDQHTTPSRHTPSAMRTCILPVALSLCTRCASMGKRLPLMACSLGVWKWNCSSSSSRPSM